MRTSHSRSSSRSGAGSGVMMTAGIVQRVLAEQALVRLVEFGVRLDDQEEIVRGLRERCDK